LHHGTSTYPSRAGARCAAVNRRAAATPADLVTKARNLDIRYCGADPETGPGPIEDRLLSFGPVRGLVFGHWSEASEHVELLLSGAAHTGALRHWTTMGARESNDALGSLAWLLRRRWGMTAWRANARLLLDRLEYVGRGAVRASTRRADAMERAAAVRRSAHWLFRRPRSTW
jgi:hypothetical protein